GADLGQFLLDRGAFGYDAAIALLLLAQVRHLAVVVKMRGDEPPVDAEHVDAQENDCEQGYREQASVFRCPVKARHRRPPLLPRAARLLPSARPSAPARPRPPARLS